MIREIILDIETTGLRAEQGHKIIEICAMEVVNGIKTGNIFHKFINPERLVPYEAFSIHGISTEFLLDKEKFAEIAEDFLDFIKEDTLVIHNSKFDVGFLNYELKNLSYQTIDFKNVLDTLVIARKKFPGSSVSLDSLCKKFKISLANREKHGALIDVELLYEVYKNLIDDRLLIKEENKNKEELVTKKLLVEKRDKLFKSPRKYECSIEEIESHIEFIKSIKDPIWNNIERE